jgi:SAM-dependent methyltransferase
MCRALRRKHGASASRSSTTRGDNVRTAVDDVLAEQVRYYRARAGEYDATSRPAGDPFAAVAARAVDALRGIGDVDRAIELGAGTGAFTSEVAAIAERVTAVDTSPEMLELNAQKVPAGNVERVVADAFSWRPVAPADLVVFTFLLSHVPRERFAEFWTAVGRMLRPDGRAFFVDETEDGLWREERRIGDANAVVERILLDGRRFRVVKVLWRPGELAERFRGIGWAADVVTETPFYWAIARPTDRATRASRARS